MAPTRIKFLIQIPSYVSRVEALNLGVGQFTGAQAKFNEGLQWWQSDRQWHYAVIRDPDKPGGDMIWAPLPNSNFSFVSGRAYTIHFDIDFVADKLRRFMIEDALSVDLSTHPMPIWNCRDAPSIEPQIQLYARSGFFAQPAELLVKHVALWNDDGTLFHQDDFDRVRWHFGMAAKGGWIRAEDGGMRLFAPPGGAVDVFKRLGEPGW